ncbi:MAG: ABC transporter ATP-binding protein [Planctomycetota bacterium]
MIEIDNITVHAGDFKLKEVSLTIPTGQYGVLMGKTGSGKTTLTEAITGLKKVASGAIRLLGRDVTRLQPAVRGIGYVPQDGALFSTMTVRNHLSYALEIRKATKDVIKKRVAELADLLGIAHLLKRIPQGLSGGEQQRVALGRAISFHPTTLLLDEPLSALDKDTRSQMYDLLREVCQHTGVTVLHVTHSTEDADALADLLFRIEDGRVLT